MNKQEIMRQLQSRIDRRSNDISELENFYWDRFDIRKAETSLERHELEYLHLLRAEQTLDKRIVGLVLDQSIAIGGLLKILENTELPDEN